MRDIRRREIGSIGTPPTARPDQPSEEPIDEWRHKGVSLLVKIPDAPDRTALVAEALAAEYARGRAEGAEEVDAEYGISVMRAQLDRAVRDRADLAARVEALAEEWAECGPDVEIHTEQVAAEVRAVLDADA